jgi:hypothetical protein
LIPSADAKIATASKNTEGAPESAILTARGSPDLGRTPPIFGATILGIAAVWLHFDRMNEIGKLDGILDEEDRNVVADEVEVALVGIEFDREAAHVAGHVPCPRAAGNGREPREQFCFLAFLGKKRALVR